LAPVLQDVGVDHGRGKIVVPEPWLNGADVGAALQQVGGEGTTQGMGIVVLGALGMKGVVEQTEHLSHCIEEFGLLTCRRVKHIRSPS
jgi:hypothetical protein